MFEIIKNNNVHIIDNLFNNFLNDRLSLLNQDFSDAYFSKDEKKYCIEIALPGAVKKDINISLEDNHLILSYASSVGEESVWNSTFNKRIKIPNDVNTDSVTAKLKNGILSIFLERKVKVVKTKVIEVK